MPLQSRTFQAVKGVDGKVTYVAKDVVNRGGQALKPVHGNSLQSQRPTWGYELYDNNDNFLKNGITSQPNPVNRYTKMFMQTHYMERFGPFPNRMGAYQWEYQQNLIQKGPLNFNLH